MKNRLLRSFGTATALAAALCLVLGAPRPEVAAQGPAAKLDFRVVTADGEPVADLKPADVTLRIGGKPRQIRSLEFVGASKAAGPAGGAPAARPAARAFSSNTAAPVDGRTLLLVVDDESVEPGRDQAMKTALRQLVAGVSPRDRVGLLSVRRGAAVNVPPTTDHATVAGAIDKLSGQAGAENAEAFRCRTMLTLQALESLLAGATGDTPTSIVFFSASLTEPGEAIGRIGQSSDLCRLVPENFDRVGQALAASRAHLYVVHVPEGTARSASVSAPGVENIAGVAGTETLRLTGTGEGLAARLLKEISGYYVATFDADPSDRAANQRVELRVTRDAARVRVRPSVTLSRLEAAAAAGAKASPKDMIRVATTYRDLPLRAAGYASRNPGDDKVKVVALFEPDGAAAKLASAVVGLFAADGKLVAQWTAQDADLGRSPVMAALTAPRGEYRMRVAAVDGAGRGGTVDYPLKADLTTAAPLTLSTPILGGAGPSGFAPKLLFGAADGAVMSYLEVYGLPKGANVTAMLELAPSEDAPALGSTAAQVRPGAAEDARLVIGGFSIESLQPGDYVVRTVLSVDGKQAGRAMATLRKGGS